MFIPKKIPILLLVLACSCQSALCQFFRHYTINEGLSNNAVYSLFQDSRGLMWFGTINGLHSFDGIQIQSIQNHDSKIEVGNLIYSIAEDDSNNLWVGTDEGLFIYNLKKGAFITFHSLNKQNKSIQAPITKILKDSKNNMWVSTINQGIYCLTTEKELIHYTASYILPSDSITNISEDSEGNLWITTFDHGICKMSLKTQKLTRFLDDKAMSNLSVFEDSKKNIWVGNRGNGLFLLNSDTGKFTQMISPQSSHNMLQIRSIIEVEPGKLALASDEGLIYYFVDSKEIKILKSSLKNPRGLNDHFIHSLCLDHEKGLWVGTYFGGVNYASPQSSNFSYYGRSNTNLRGRIVSAFEEDKKGNLWVGTDDAGYFYWDREKNSFTPYTSKATYQNVHALLQDDENLYIGMYLGGLDILNLKTGNVKNFLAGTSTNSLYSSSVYSLYKDSHNILWIGTSSGLNIYDISTHRFNRIPQVRNADVTHICEDLRGYLWVTTLNKGIFRLNRKDGKWTNFTHDSKNKKSLSSNKIITIAIDKQQHLWVGTNGKGVCKFDYSTESFTQIPSIQKVGGVIYKIIPEQEKLWISTSNGLLNYNPEKDKIKIYNKNDGLQDNQFSVNAGIKTTDGTLYFGGINGFNGLKPSQMTTNNHSPKILFTDFSLFNKHVDNQSQDSLLVNSIAYTGKITLKSKHSIFSIDFASLSYISPEKNKYAYLLEGFEKEWTEISDVPRAHYTNLPQGSYTFRVKASNSDDVWNNEGISIKIRVLPPLLLSAPFLFIYSLLFIGILLLLFQRMKKSHKKEIEYIRIEKEKQLYDAKIEFFTNIAHEIRTPLSLILAPLAHVMNSRGKIDDHMPDLKVIKRNAQRLLHLVNQLMDFRKIEETGIKMKPEVINLKTMVKDQSKRFELSANLKNISLHLTLPEKNCFVYADSDSLTKIISNLLSNAIKFTSSDIWINLSEDKKQSQYILSVKDNGLGIVPSQQQKIFKPFYQIKENSPKDSIGTGVGLFLVKKLVDLQQGGISIVSENGNGAEFLVSLPMSEHSREQKKTKKDKVKTSNSNNKSTELASLLIVDDNHDLLTFLSDLFTNQYNVITAKDGKEAIDILENQLPDAVISDIMMPNINGIELCARIKKNIRSSHIPVLLLSAKVDNSDQIQGLDSGADVYVTKPFSADFLKAQVKSLLINRSRVKETFANEPLVSVSTVANTEMDKKFLDKMSAEIHNQMVETDFSVDILAKSLNMGRSSFYEKVKGITGLTPNEFIRVIRLKKAAEIFTTEDATVSEVCFRVGFSSPSYFAKCFQVQFGVTPSAFQKGIRE